MQLAAAAIEQINKSEAEPAGIGQCAADQNVVADHAEILELFIEKASLPARDRFAKG